MSAPETAPKPEWRKEAVLALADADEVLEEYRRGLVVSDASASNLIAQLVSLLRQAREEHTT